MNKKYVNNCTATIYIYGKFSPNKATKKLNFLNISENYPNVNLKYKVNIQQFLKSTGSLKDKGEVLLETEKRKTWTAIKNLFIIC